MRGSSSALILYLLVTTAGISGIWYITSYNQPRGRMSLASVSEMRGGNGATNASQVRLRNRELNQIEDQLRRSLESLAPDQSIDSTLSTYRTAPPIVQPTRRERDELDRKKNWMFLTPEELAPTMSPQDFLRIKGLEGEETAASGKGSTAMDRYFQRLEKRTASSLQPNPLSEEDLPGAVSSKKPAAQASVRRDEADEPAAVRRSENALRDLVTASRDTPAASSIEPQLFGEAFNADQGKSFVDPDAHRAYMKEYEGWLKNAVGSSRGTDPLAGLPGSAPAASAAGAATRGPDLMGTGSRRSDFGSTAAAINPGLTPSPVPDPNARVLNQWNTMYEPPKLQTPATVAPTMPPAEAPRRKFF